MNITGRPNLKPLRQYSPHDEINLYSATTDTLNRGTFVTITTASGNTNVLQSAGQAFLTSAGSVGEGPSRVTSTRQQVSWKVKAANSGEVVLGIALFDVRETNKYGEKYLWRPRYERAEQDIVLSGEAVPIAVRGFFKTNAFTGTAAVNSGINIVSGGIGIVGVYSKSTSIAKFLSTADADGYALIYLNA